jgi:hypothetical protein
MAGNPDTQPPADTDEKTIEATPADVLDPADYNQNQRLKEIHQARNDVREALKNVTRGKAAPAEHHETRDTLAQAVAFYGYELLPLMDEADWSHEFDADEPPYTVRDFIHRLGQFHDVSDWDATPPSLSMVVFQKLNSFAQQAGLGADFDTDTDEWEV